MDPRAGDRPRVRWVGIEFTATEEFYEFAAALPTDIRNMLIREEAYPVSGGPDLRAIVVNNEIVGFGVPIDFVPYSRSTIQRTNALAKHVRTVLTSMGCTRTFDSWVGER